MITDDLLRSDNRFISDTFKIINARRGNIAGDSNTSVYQLTESDCRELQALAEEQVLANYIGAGIKTQTLDEVRNEMRTVIGDELINHETGIGTFSDPAVYTHSTIPIMIGAADETALYASGGLPALIIDKKARGQVSNGISFTTNDDDLWSNDDIEMLEDTAQETGLNDMLSDAITDAYVYGGSIIMPFFKDESPTSLLKPIQKLNLEKGCIDRWVSVDRWNLTTVPSYKVLHKDYINPETMFIPQDAVEVSCSRMGILRPKPMPYWATLYNLGWAPSDFTGWMRSYYAYKATMQAVPMMAQQCSLILYRMPLDSLNATVGPDSVEKIMDINRESMKGWSATKPEAVNMVGEVEVVNRSFGGIEHLLGAMKSDLASQCEIPEPSLWHTPNKGFSDNTQESLLKSSENMQMRQRYIERSLKPIRDILIAHTFGQDSKQYKNKDKLYTTLAKPVISTEKDMAEVGARFAASVSSLVSASIAPDTAMELSKVFFPAVKITDDQIAQVKKQYEEQQKQQQEMQKQQMQMKAQMGGGIGGSSSSGQKKPNIGPKTQTPSIGHYSKPA